MVLTVRIAGCRVTTVEGLRDDELFEKLVESFTKHGSIQCGFCTPGFLLTAYALYKKKKEPSIDEVLKAIEGNLCRCTGYKKIVEAIVDIGH